MKQFFTVLLFISISVAQAQKNKQAIKMTETLSKVMGLTEDEKEKVLVLETEKFQKIKVLRKRHGKNKEAFKIEARPVHQDFNKKLRSLVGKEKMKLLIAYRKKNKNK